WPMQWLRRTTKQPKNSGRPDGVAGAKKMRAQDDGRGRHREVAERNPRLILAVGAVIGLVAVVLASRLQLRTSFAELLPSGDPAVQALRRAEGRVGDLTLLTVGIRSPDRAANLAYAKALTESLRTLPSSRI